MNELIEVEASNLAELMIRRPPASVIEEARQAAVALKDVLDKKPNKVMMNGEQFLEFEDWQTVAQFYNCKAKVIETKPVQFGEVMGFEATAVAFHVSSGREVGRAESMCLNDEEKWSSRNKYEWAYCKKSGGHSVEDPGPTELIWVKRPDTGRMAPKKEKILTGQEHVPLFQLRSMAQTRACSKVLRNAFAWVVVLAGYKPTPAEELLEAVKVPQEPAPAEARQEDGARPGVESGSISTGHDHQQSSDAPATRPTTGSGASGGPASVTDAPASVFDESSAVADHQTAIADCVTDDDYRMARLDVTNDKRLTDETRSPLYADILRKAKAARAKK